MNAEQRTLAVTAVLALALVATAGTAAAVTTGASNAQTTANGPTVDWAVAEHGTVHVRFSTAVAASSVSASDFSVSTDRGVSTGVSVGDDDGDRYLVLEVGDAAAPGYRTTLDVGEVASTSGATNAPGSVPVPALGTAVRQGGANGTAADAAQVYAGSPGERVSFRSQSPNATVRIFDSSGNGVVQLSTGPTGVATVNAGNFDPGATYRATFATGSGQSSQYFAVNRPGLSASVDSRALDVPSDLGYGAAPNHGSGLVRFTVVDASGDVLDDYPEPVGADGTASGSTLVDTPGRYKVRVTDLRTGAERTSPALTAVQGTVVTQGGANDAPNSAATVYQGDTLAVVTNRPNVTVELTPAGETATEETLSSGINGVAPIDTESLSVGTDYEVSFGTGSGTQYVSVRPLQVGVSVNRTTARPGDRVAFQATASRGGAPVRVLLLDSSGSIVEESVQGWGDGGRDGALTLASSGTYRVRVVDLVTGTRATSPPIEVSDGSGDETPGPVGTHSALPNDPDDDGLFEDVNGNDRQDIADAVDLFRHRNSLDGQFFDFNGANGVSIGDAVALFRENAG